MTATSIDAVLSCLPKLSASDLLKVKNKAQALLSLSGGAFAASADEEPAIDYLLEGIFHELHRRGLLRKDGRIPAKAWPSGYRTKAANTRALLEENIGKPLSEKEKLQLGRVAAEVLARYLQHKAPISANVLMSNVDKIPQALDAALPGYLQSGLLIVVLKRGLAL